MFIRNAQRIEEIPMKKQAISIFLMSTSVVVIQSHACLHSETSEALKMLHQQRQNSASRYSYCAFVEERGPFRLKHVI